MSKEIKYVPFEKAATYCFCEHKGTKMHCSKTTECPFKKKGMPKLINVDPKALTLDEIVERMKKVAVNFMLDKNTNHADIVEMYVEGILKAFAEEFICKK